MIIYKTQEQIETIAEGGHILSGVLDAIIAMVRPGVTTAELDHQAQRLMREAGGEPSFLHYQIASDVVPFNSAVCTSINEEVVHAPAHPGRPLREGDIIGLDIGMKYKGLYTDMAKTVAVGSITKEAQRLLTVTNDALHAGLAQVQEGNSIADISKAVEAVAKKHGYGIVRDLVGHGVGVKVHEDPQIPNYYVPGTEKVKLKRGMVIAIEPMITVGDHAITVAEDGWTCVTEDKSLAAQFEHTIAIDHEGRVRIMTE